MAALAGVVLDRIVLQDHRPSFLATSAKSCGTVPSRCRTPTRERIPLSIPVPSNSL